MSILLSFRTHTRHAVAWLALVTLAARPIAAQQGPPETRQDSVRDVLHGVELVDPYRWLEDQQAADTRTWIDAQNRYTESLIGNLAGQAALKARIAELLTVDAIGAPTVRGGRYFFTKRAADQDLFVIYMREGRDGEDVALIDPSIMAVEEAMSVTMMDVSEDGTLLSYGIRRGGQDEVTVRFYDVDRQRVLADVLPESRYFGVEITPDRSGFYYTAFDMMTGPRIRYHQFGADVADDADLFGAELGPGMIAFAQLSDEGDKLLITVSQGSSGSNEVYLMDLASGGPAVPIVTGVDANFFVTFAGADQLVIQTNHEAPNWHILRADLANPTMDHWSEVVPEGESVIQGFGLAGGRIFVSYLENVISRVKVYEISGAHVRDLDLPGLGSIGGVAGDWDRDEVFFSFSSYNLPSTMYRYSVSQNTREVWTRSEIPFDGDGYEVKQVWYQSKDGTRIPMFLMHRRGLQLDGTNPTYLTGYGGFNVNRTPGFSALAAAWAEQGGVYAVPNLRGGGEFGEAWHEAGMLENKQNVFDDFIGAAEWLIENGYTSSEKLAIAGGSNGGLLVGAAVTQRPDLFGAVYCGYPLLDMVRYQQFLVARFWVPEYGSSEDAEQFEYIRAYSPYHNVVQGTEYPAVMFDTGDADTRVAPLHARKMAALMQAATGSDRPILLRYDTEAGHSGGAPIGKTINDLTARLSFLLWQLGEQMGATTP
jgi:prolyl oligopeptidase